MSADLKLCKGCKYEDRNCDLRRTIYVERCVRRWIEEYLERHPEDKSRVYFNAVYQKVRDV
jgi:hypothetical protein